MMRSEDIEKQRERTKKTHYIDSIQNIIDGLGGNIASRKAKMHGVTEVELEKLFESVKASKSLAEAVGHVSNSIEDRRQSLESEQKGHA